MPPRRERILGLDRLSGIEIADLADRLMEVWPHERSEVENIAQARVHLDALASSVDQIARTVVDLRAELERIAR